MLTCALEGKVDKECSICLPGSAVVIHRQVLARQWRASHIRWIPGNLTINLKAPVALTATNGMHLVQQHQHFSVQTVHMPAMHTSTLGWKDMLQSSYACPTYCAATRSNTAQSSCTQGRPSLVLWTLIQFTAHHNQPPSHCTTPRHVSYVRVANKLERMTWQNFSRFMCTEFT